MTSGRNLVNLQQMKRGRREETYEKTSYEVTLATRRIPSNLAIRLARHGRPGLHMLNDNTVRLRSLEGRPSACSSVAKNERTAEEKEEVELRGSTEDRTRQPFLGWFLVLDSLKRRDTVLAWSPAN